MRFSEEQLVFGCRVIDEIRTDSDVIYSNNFYRVIQVSDYVLDRGFFLVSNKRLQECYSYNTAPVRQFLDLLVSHIAPGDLTMVERVQVAATSVRDDRDSIV